MYNMFDILQSQGDASVRAFGQQFGLSPDQTRRAMEALLPALTMGMQRNAATDPMGLGRLFGLGASGPSPVPGSPDFLSGLFGSPMLGHAVIQQAASASGVGAQALRQMLPVMAGMLVAGIVHLLLNPPAQAQAPAPPPSPFPVGTVWTDWLNGLTAAAAQVTPSPTPVTRRPEPRTTGRKTAAPPAPDAAKASMEVIQQMLQTGAEVQEQNVKAMRDVFDAFWSKPEPDANASGTASPATSRTVPSEGPRDPLPPRRRPGTKG